MGFIKADLMDQATTSQAVCQGTKHKRDCLELAYSKKVDQAFVEWEKKELNIGTNATPSSFLSLLASTNASSSSPANKEFGMPTPSSSTTMCHGHAESASLVVLGPPRMPMPLGLPFSPTVPPSTQPMSTLMATLTVSSPLHIFDAAGTSHMVHTIGCGKVLTPAPTKSFSRLATPTCTTCPTTPMPPVRTSSMVLEKNVLVKLNTTCMSCTSSIILVLGWTV
ncbi:hypothetical protein DACRYDRAFT_21515 [Dacryopinax primogenitus]|uniref:Uncharacterized protein n=1 Tax=Dacryopinax primogenitus (strain DJM 731) TaxID=1858805 RepID=M5G4Z8_DACPD|nr:uncharacterized protein DACRYDRAFT_21515 [Dacryopinax primogenitus]EJU03300.1 hypothetical protein DACRYDRAFT_21515 [Dacryopinax primogenitus]